MPSPQSNVARDAHPLVTARSFQVALLAALVVLGSCVVAPPEAAYRAPYPADYGYAPGPYYAGYPWYFGPEVGIGVGVGRGWHGGGRHRGGRR